MSKPNPLNINPLDLYTKSQLCSISSNMWSRPATALLIEMYRKLECLWKTSCVYYRNKKKRHDALQEIAAAISPFRPDTTAEDVKNKINGIRTQYVAEKNKVSFYAKKNLSAEYEPSLWCYDRLSFLAGYTSLKNKPNEGGSTNSVSNNEDLEVVENEMQVKIEHHDETEPNESRDFNTCEDNNEADSPHHSVEYINIEPYRKKAKTSKNQQYEKEIEKRQEMKSSQHKGNTSAPSDDIGEDDQTNFFQKPDESVFYTGNEDWIDVFGKFVSTQMKLISNKTLLIQLQHTIQSAIMNTQLKQIELDKQ